MKVGKDVNLATIDWGDGWSYVSSNILADGSTEVLLEYSDKVNYNNYTATVIVTTLSEKPDELETPEVPDELETPTEPTVPEAPSQNEENNADDPASIAMKVVAIALVALVAGAGIFILANFIISKKKKH
jgi:hypothetical protein